MDYDSLSQNGIEKVLNNAPSIVQIIDFQVKQKGDTNFYIVQLNDGFARLKKCVIMPQNQKKVKNFDIIRTEIVTPNMKDGKPMHVLIDQYSIVRADINFMIGDPINYADWEKTKRNPKGDNIIPQLKKTTGNTKMNKGPVKPNVNMDSLFDDQQEENQRQPLKNGKPVGNNKRNSEIQSTQSITHSTKPNMQQRSGQNSIIQAQPNNKNSNNYSINQTKQVSNQVKLQNRNAQSETRHDRTHTLIKELYEGMQDWKLKLRIIFMSPVKTYVKKANGQQSQLFAFQGCDQFDSIQLTVFGESATNFSQIINIDNIYEISGGKVVKDDRTNKLKIILTQKSVINILQDDITIPMVDQFCITPQKLLQKDIGSDWNVVALVKDNGEIIEFVSKNGKNCRKKEIYLCDPEAQIQVPITLWFDKADLKFEKIPYAFQGISVSSFNDQKQFQASIKFNFRPFKQHQYRKFINSFEKMKLQNPVHDFSGKNKPNYELVNFLVFRTQAEKLENNNTLTIQKACYLTQISLTSRNSYMSCPYCKKKVIEEQNGSCSSDKCGKSYQRAKYRYLLNVSLSDEVETIWATAYDDAAEVMLTSEVDGSVLTADEYVKIDQEDLKLRIPSFLDRQMKVVITAKKQTYNGQERVKYGVNKAVLDIDYVNQANFLAKQIEYLSCKVNRK